MIFRFITDNDMKHSIPGQAVPCNFRGNNPYKDACPVGSVENQRLSGGDGTDPDGGFEQVGVRTSTVQYGRDDCPCTRPATTGFMITPTTHTKRVHA